MKKLFITIILLSAIFTNNLLAQNISFGGDFVSKYVWRGYTLADGFSVQPNVDLTIDGLPLSFNVWGSFALADRDKYEAADELDFTVSAELDAGFASLTPGFIVYTFPSVDEDNVSYEAFFGASFHALPFLNPSLALYYDFELGDGLYAAFDVNHTIATVVTVGSTLGYNGGQFGAEKGLAHINFYTSTELTLGVVTVSPSATFVINTEDTVNKEDSEFYFGLGFAF